jgi:hypothetical protein
MTEGLAIEIACSKMRELGVGKNYLVRYRHFQLLAGETVERKHWGELMILLTPEKSTRVISTLGTFDLADRAINEQQYVFTGKILIQNTSSTTPLNVKFLQVIPLLKSK